MPEHHPGASLHPHNTDALIIDTLINAQHADPFVIRRAGPAPAQDGEIEVLLILFNASSRAVTFTAPMPAPWYVLPDTAQPDVMPYALGGQTLEAVAHALVFMGEHPACEAGAVTPQATPPHDTNDASAAG